MMPLAPLVIMFLNNFIQIFTMLLILVVFVSDIALINLYVFQILVMMPILIYKRRCFLKKDFFEYLIVAVFVFSMLIAVFNQSYKAMFLPLYIFYSYLFAEYLFTRKDADKVFLFIFYMYVIWFLMKGVSSGFSPVNINDYIVSKSRNAVSWLAIALVMAYNLVLLTQNKKVALLPTIICFFICFFSFGRSGILISFIMLSLVFYFRFKNLHLYIKFLVFIPSFLAFFIFYQDFDFVFNLIESKTNFTNGIESPRSLINEEYLSNMDLRSVIWGYDTSNLITAKPYDGNVHNSFIYFHSRSGIVMLMFFILPFLKLFTQIKSEDFFILFSFLILFMVRVSVDIIAFPGPMDFIFMYILLACNNLKNKINAH